MWRQQSMKLPAGLGASDFELSSGETMQDVLRSVLDFEFFYLDLTKGIPLRVQIRDPFRGIAPDSPGEQFDSFIFIREAAPMKDQCPPVKE